ncbi:MAG: hypothetical protein AAB839_01265 [Patescibacteria group bacterium]
MSITDPRESIHRVVRCAVFAEDVELIDIPTTGDALVLLRSKKMPEFAFVLWTTRLTTTRAQMSFRYSGERRSFNYSVVCACCPSEGYGKQIPSERSEERKKEWAAAEKKSFGAAMQEVCRVNAIRTIFMRRADSWRDRYGDLVDVEVVEACNHAEAYGELYGRRTVREALRFIHEHSQGLGGQY